MRLYEIDFACILDNILYYAYNVFIFDFYD